MGLASNVNVIMTISFKYYRNSNRGRTMWRIVSLPITNHVERGTLGLFLGTKRLLEVLWDLIHFHSSFLAYCTNIF